MPVPGASTAPDADLPPALVAALAAAPRSYLLPPLPADPQSAAAASAPAAVAAALEAARMALESGTHPPAPWEAVFTRGLARLLELALDPQRGEPAYRAEVLRAGDPLLQEHVRLQAQARADQRVVRSAVDAIAHPGKLRAAADAPWRAALEGLHVRSVQGDWDGLARALETLQTGPALQGPVARLQTHPALGRLLRGAALAQQPAVQAYEALRAASGPAAGSAAALAEGRATRDSGRRAEEATAAAFHGLAQALQAGAPAGPAWRVAQGLRLPRGFPGEAGGKAKEEWDVALLRDAGEAGWDLVLLAEVKAAPAAASADLGRLLRGLRRLALADPRAGARLEAVDGPQQLTGRSLRALAPRGFALPPQALYCCTAPAETQPVLLDAAARAVLLREPACLAWARAALAGTPPPADQLAPVWHMLADAPHLRAALHQYATAQAARGAMLHPSELRLA